MTTATDVDHLRESQLSRQEIYRGYIVNVYKDLVALPSGRQSSRDVIEHPGAVGVLALNSGGEVLLVRQWRYPVGRPLWEICAGTLKPGEDPLECAKRELSEETGYEAGSWTLLGEIYLAPGYSSELMHLFVARDLVAGDPHADEDEVLDVAFFPPTSLSGLASTNELDAKTLAAFALGRIPLNG